MLIALGWVGVNARRGDSGSSARNRARRLSFSEILRARVFADVIFDVIVSTLLDPACRGVSKQTFSSLRLTTHCARHIRIVAFLRSLFWNCRDTKTMEVRICREEGWWEEVQNAHNGRDGRSELASDSLREGQ
jgi:hypothetical protein